MRAIAFNPIGNRELWLGDTGRNALVRATLDANRAVEEVVVTTPLTTDYPDRPTPALPALPPGTS